MTQFTDVEDLEQTLWTTVFMQRKNRFEHEYWSFAYQSKSLRLILGGFKP